jgi:hypothetical protein
MKRKKKKKKKIKMGITDPTKKNPQVPGKGKHFLLLIKVVVMVFTTTFNNISIISWQSVLLNLELKVSSKSINIHF